MRKATQIPPGSRRKLVLILVVDLALFGVFVAGATITAGPMRASLAVLAALSLILAAIVIVGLAVIHSILSRAQGGH